MSGHDKPLSKEENAQYKVLIDAAKTRKAEDESLLKKVGGIAFVGVGYLVAGDTIDREYPYRDLDTRQEGVSEREHFNLLKSHEKRLLKQTEAERREDDLKLVRDLGKKIGRNIGIGETAGSAYAEGAFNAGEKIKSEIHEHQEADTAGRAVEQLDKLKNDIGENLPAWEKRLNEIAGNVLQFLKETNCKYSNSQTPECWQINNTPLPPPAERSEKQR